MSYTKQIDKTIKKKRKAAESSKYGAYNDKEKNSELLKALKAKKLLKYMENTSSPSDQKYMRKKK